VKFSRLVCSRSREAADRRWLGALLASVFCCFAFAQTTPGPAKPVPSATMQNVFQLEDGLYSGSAPETDAAFAELAKLGVKTIVSVDGSKPNVELAHQYGLHYVHLPIGYDGVPQQRSAEFVKVLREADGPIYFHCHHGKHRGPAAAAAACVAAKGWTNERALAFLQEAGTAAEYAGLFRDVRAYRPPTPEELAHVPARLPEIAKTPPLVDTMVSIDERFDALKALQKSGWSTPLGKPTSAEAATLLWEQFRELQRDPALESHGADFQKKLAAAEDSVAALRTLLNDASSPKTARDDAMKAATESCNVCHKAHRN